MNYNEIYTLIDKIKWATRESDVLKKKARELENLVEDVENKTVPMYRPDNYEKE